MEDDYVQINIYKNTLRSLENRGVLLGMLLENNGIKDYSIGEVRLARKPMIRAEETDLHTPPASPDSSYMSALGSRNSENINISRDFDMTIGLDQLGDNYLEAPYGVRKPSSKPVLQQLTTVKRPETQAEELFDSKVYNLRRMPSRTLGRRETSSYQPQGMFESEYDGDDVEQPVYNIPRATSPSFLSASETGSGLADTENIDISRDFDMTIGLDQLGDNYLEAPYGVRKSSSEPVLQPDSKVYNLRKVPSRTLARRDTSSYRETSAPTATKKNGPGDMLTVQCRWPSCKTTINWRAKYGKTRFFDHVLCHSDEKLIECHKCEHTFSTVRQLTYHFKQSHKGDKFKGYGVTNLNIPDDVLVPLWKKCYPDISPVKCRGKRK